MFIGVVIRHILMVHLCSSTTLGVVVCLYSSQTEVCQLCVGVVLGTTISIAICCISRPSFFLGMTLGMLSVFTALRLKFVHCVLGL